MQLDGTDPEHKAAREKLWERAKAKPGTYPILYHPASGFACKGDEVQELIDSGAIYRKLATPVLSSTLRAPFELPSSKPLLRQVAARPMFEHVGESGTASADGWHEATDANGKTYYYNATTSEVRWERGDSPESALLEGWHEAKTAEGKAYFYNAATNETKWERPVKPLPRPAPRPTARQLNPGARTTPPSRTTPPPTRPSAPTGVGDPGRLASATQGAVPGGRAPANANGNGPALARCEPGPSRTVSFGPAGAGNDKVAALLGWCQEQVAGAPYHLELPSFRAFSDGLAFCALLHAHFPSAVPYGNLRAGDVEKNCSLAFRVAEEHAGITRLLDVQDMVALFPRPDTKSVILYVSFLHAELSMRRATPALVTLQSARSRQGSARGHPGLYRSNTEMMMSDHI